MAKFFKIRDLCEARGISMAQFAREIGMTTQNIQRIINENSTKVEILELMCRYFGVPVGYFFDESECDSTILDLKNELDKINKELNEANKTIEFQKGKLEVYDRILGNQKMTDTTKQTIASK